MSDSTKIKKQLNDEQFQQVCNDLGDLVNKHIENDFILWENQFNKEYFYFLRNSIIDLINKVNNESLNNE
jgi:hypothetical protein